MEAKYISRDRILSKEEQAKFDQEFNITSDTQKTYGQIIAGIMEKKGIDNYKAAELTGLNKQLFLNLDKPGGKIEKRFVVSIAVGFGLDVHTTEYLLESCGMRFNVSDRLDKAYITLIEKYKGRDIEDCNAILRDLGIEGKYMLGELQGPPHKTHKRHKISKEQG